VRKVYAKNITYSVQPYSIYNVKSDVAPQGKIKNFVKEYNYIYTGQNVDVLDFEINFNTLYYTAQTAYRSALTDIYKNSNSADENYKKKNTDAEDVFKDKRRDDKSGNSKSIGKLNSPRL
jgi:hypothetical protein